METALLYSIGLFVIDTPWYVVACVPFWNQRRLSKGAILAVIIGLGALRAAVAFLMAMYIPDWRAARWIPYLAHTVILLVFYCISFRVSIPKLLYTILLLQAVSTTVNFLAYTVLAPFYPNTNIGTATLPAYTIAVTIGNAAAIPLTFRLFRGRLRQAFDELPGKGILLLCVTPILFLGIQQGYLTLVESMTNNFGVALLNILVMATGLVSYYINLRTVLDSARRVRLENEMQTQLALSAQGYENLTQNIEATRAARHDLRHHISVIRDFTQRDDKAGLTVYLDEFIATLPVDTMQSWCENRPVNVVAGHYLAKAESAGAKLNIKLDVPQRTGIPDADLCVVVGNILENAANSVAARDGGFIHAQCADSDTDLVLMVENSAGPGGKHGEGLGLRNVEAVAKRYGGTARFEQKDGVYISKILLVKPPIAKQP